MLRKLLDDVAQNPAEHKGKRAPLEIEVNAQDLHEATHAIIERAHVRFVTCFATPEPRGGFDVRYVYAHKTSGFLLVTRTPLGATQKLPAVTSILPAANWLEREMSELLGVPLEGHPDPRPVLQHRGWPLGAHPLQPEWRPTPTTKRLEEDPDYGFLQVEGDGVCEVPVGPIHAGIIEPGHFRFSIAGEPVLNLEIRLGYQHKGIEKLYQGRTAQMGLFLAERTSGDNSAAHAAAYCMAIESLSDARLSPSAEDARVLYLELERITHHLGDIGGVLLDVAYNFGASQLAILREEMFRLNSRLTGSRLLFGANAVGGVRHEPTTDEQQDIRKTLAKVTHDFDKALKVSLTSASVVDRLDQAGTLTLENAKLLSVVGPAARASGLDVDARRDTPHLAYVRRKVNVQLETRGDVMSRVRVKANELR
ncbi:MAG: NADH-quinone oxidoreductase subunit C, partial [Candidatus Thermoplasmatota archaeon]